MKMWICLSITDWCTNSKTDFQQIWRVSSGWSDKVQGTRSAQNSLWWVKGKASQTNKHPLEQLKHTNDNRQNLNLKTLQTRKPPWIHTRSPKGKQPGQTLRLQACSATELLLSSGRCSTVNSSRISVFNNNKWFCCITLREASL